MDTFTWWLIGGLCAGLASVCFYCLCVGIGKLFDLFTGDKK